MYLQEVLWMHITPPTKLGSVIREYHLYFEFILVFAANMDRSNLYLKLFKLVFGSVSLLAAENEQMLKVSFRYLVPFKKIHISQFVIYVNDKAAVETYILFSIYD